MAKKAAKQTTRKKSRKKPVVAEPLDASPGASAVLTPLAGLVGQDAAVSVLDNARRADRVHHAWIFTGPEGVGKRTAALGLARELLLPASGEADPAWGEIGGLLERGQHPDLHVVSASLAAVSRTPEIRTRKQTTLPREVLSEFLVEPSQRTRSMVADSAASKVFIVDNAHQMGDAAQNLLLKTLEEPPAGTVIVLVTQSEDRLLPTIRSRCQRVVFGPLRAEAMSTLAERLTAGMDEKERYIALALADGSPGRLEQVIAGGLVSWAQSLEAMFRAQEAGQAVPELGPTMTELVQAEASRQVGGDKLASKEAANRRAAADMLRLVAERHRRQLRRSAEDEHARVRYASAIEAVQRTEREIASNVPLQHAFGLLAAELAGAVEV